MVTYTQLLILVACTAGLAVFVFINWITYRRLHRDPGVLDAQPVTVLVQAAPQIESRSEGFSEEERERALFYMHQEQIRRLCDAKIEVVKSVVATQNRIAVIQADVIRLQAEKELHMLASSGPEPVMISHERDDGERAAGLRATRVGSAGATGASAQSIGQAAPGKPQAASSSDEGDHPSSGLDGELEEVEGEVVDASAVPTASSARSAPSTAQTMNGDAEAPDDPDVIRINQLREEQEHLGMEAKARLAEIDAQIRTLAGASTEAWMREQAVATAGEIPLSEAGSRPYRPG